LDLVAREPGGQALEVQALRSGYGQSEVLHGVDLRIHPGETYAVLGKNGMGKTTLLRAIMGLLPAWAGSVRLFGRDLAGDSTHKRARHSLSYVPQERALFPDLSVEENLRLGLNRPAEFHDQLDRIASLFPILPARLKQRAGTLSGGEQKMLLVGRSMMSQPRVMLIDEISEGLQPSVREALAGALRAERETRGVTILLVEQNLDFAFAIADTYGLLKRGAIVEEGQTGAPEARTSVARHLAV
jgi:ABC-type branched-subunit amino acid transport system ATPase component